MGGCKLHHRTNLAIKLIITPKIENRLFFLSHSPSLVDEEPLANVESVDRHPRMALPNVSLSINE